MSNWLLCCEINQSITDAILASRLDLEYHPHKPGRTRSIARCIVFKTVKKGQHYCWLVRDQLCGGMAWRKIFCAIGGGDNLAPTLWQWIVACGGGGEFVHDV